MPEECIALLQDYIDLLTKNAGYLAQELEKIAQELPDRWPDVSRIPPDDLRWGPNRINDRLEDPAPKAQAIIKFIRNYCSSNELFER